MKPRGPFVHAYMRARAPRYVYTQGYIVLHVGPRAQCLSVRTNAARAARTPFGSRVRAKTTKVKNPNQKGRKKKHEAHHPDTD